MVGSVTFWVETAPAPARAQGQRLATQMLEVVMATPSMPVSAQRPMREKVICASPSCLAPSLALAFALAPAVRFSGITAQTSISITHSGRARPWTMRPVETGKTPFSHFPTTR